MVALATSMRRLREGPGTQLSMQISHVYRSVAGPVITTYQLLNPTPQVMFSELPHASCACVLQAAARE